MNFKKVAPLLILASCLSARAGVLYQDVFSGGFANTGNIPDGNSTGWNDMQTLGGMSGTISSITVNLNIQGGYNGDLYGYLSYNGNLVTLLNRPGVGSATPGSTAFGYGDTGFNVTLSSTGANNIHFYQNSGPSYNGNGQLTGTWQPDGRAVNPLGSPSTFDSTSGLQTLDSYNGMSPDGTWTLFIADLSAGGGQSQVISYELDITTVPEPVNIALAGFGGLFAIGGLLRKNLLSGIFEKISPQA
jgi:hypothetical protein